MFNLKGTFSSGISRVLNERGEEPGESGGDKQEEERQLKEEEENRRTERAGDKKD